MNAKYRLKKSYQFNHVYKKGASVSDRYLVLLYVKTKAPEVRVGFPVSKKHGKAVRRNRLKRLLRASAQRLLPTVCAGHLLIVLPRESAPCDFKTLFASFETLLRRARLIIGTKAGENV